MATHKSAIKRHRQSVKRNAQNRDARSAVRTAIKKARAAAQAGDPNAKELLKAAEKSIAKAATKGLYHRRNAARKVSRLATLANRKSAAK